MTKISNLLIATKVLEEINSPINGKISVIKSLGFGTYIQVGDLTQSGGVVYNIWKYALKKIRKVKPDVKNCLILGLGGGSAASIISKLWPKVKITGVEIDKEMVRLGEKHLGLKDVKVKIGDAYQFSKKEKNKYDLILVDLYVGDIYPAKFETDAFLKNVMKLLKTDGVAVFNRLYYLEKRPSAMKFGKKLRKHFTEVNSIFPEANLIFLCWA